MGNLDIKSVQNTSTAFQTINIKSKKSEATKDNNTDQLTEALSGSNKKAANPITVKEKSELSKPHCDIDKSKNNKFDFSECLKNLGKGMISPITAIIKHPIVTLGTVAATVVACNFVPALGVALAVGFGAWSVFEIGKGSYDAVNNYKKGKFDESEKSFENIGQGMIGALLSFAGLKASARVAKESKLMSKFKVDKLPFELKQAIARDINSNSDLNALKESVSLFTTKEGIKATCKSFSPSRIKQRYFDILPASIRSKRTQKANFDFDKKDVPTIPAKEINIQKKVLSPDPQYLRNLTDKYSQSDEQIAQTTKDVVAYLKNISANLEDTACIAKADEVEEILARKAVVDYLIKHVKYEKFKDIDMAEFWTNEGGVGFRFGLPAKKIKDLSGFKEAFDKSVSYFKENGILDISQYDCKKHQINPEEIMKVLAKRAHYENQQKYDKLFDPICRLDGSSYGCSDMHLNSRADFYRIISPQELKALLETRKTGEYIDAYGHFTADHYSCITTNPYYNEQAFELNGLPIRLKFKTKIDGLYNMDLMNRIGTIKPERSIYEVSGYNYYDIDWENVCIKRGGEWYRLSKDEISEIIPWF